jgi:hypothetical protein
MNIFPFFPFLNLSLFFSCFTYIIINELISSIRRKKFKASAAAQQS